MQKCALGLGLCHEGCGGQIRKDASLLTPDSGVLSLMASSLTYCYIPVPFTYRYLVTTLTYRSLIVIYLVTLDACVCPACTFSRLCFNKGLLGVAGFCTMVLVFMACM